MQLNSYRNIWKVAYPIIAGSVAQNIINVVDTAFLGQLGPHQLGAAGNAIIFYFIFNVFGMGFAIGSEILAGRRNGEGEYLKIGAIIDHAFYLLIPLALFLFSFLYFFGDGILSVFTRDETILTYSTEYLEVRKYGLFFAFINLCFRIFFVGTTRTSILTWSTGFMAIINVIFDYLFIFGHYGFPEMGVKGAALASVIAEACTTVFFFAYTWKKIDRHTYQLLRFKKFQADIARRMFKIASPIMMQNFMAITSWMIFFLIIEKIGAEALAISHITRSIYMVLMIPLFGFAAATNSLVSNVIGMGRQSEVLSLTKKVIFLSLAATSIFLPFVLIIPRIFISFYTTDLAIIEGTVPVLHVISVAMYFFSLAFILFSAVSGSGNTLVSMAIEAITLVIYLSSAWALGIYYELPLYMVWFSEFIYFTAIGSLSYLYLKFGNWRLKVI